MSQIWFNDDRNQFFSAELLLIRSFSHYDKNINQNEMHDFGHNLS